MPLTLCCTGIHFHVTTPECFYLPRLFAMSSGIESVCTAHIVASCRLPGVIHVYMHVSCATAALALHGCQNERER
jgi:hypothetical protein